jgi:hypothetical protein
MEVSYAYLLFNNLAVWNLRGITMSLLCKFLDAGFISVSFQIRMNLRIKDGLQVESILYVFNYKNEARFVGFWSKDIKKG